MSTKKEYTLEELEKKYEDARTNFEFFKTEFEQKKKKEEELKRQKLAEEKITRKKEVDDAFENYKTLLEAYINDYGIYSYAADENIFGLFSPKFWNLIM